MTNMVISHIDRCKYAASIATDSESSTLIVENLQDQRLSCLWRSDSDTSAYVLVDFGAVYSIGFAALLNHNLQAGTATARLRLSTGAAPGAGGEIITWDSGSYTVPSDNGLFTPVIYGIIPTADVSAQFMRVDLADATNPAGYLQAGRIWAGPCFRPAYNHEWRWRMQVVDPSTTERSMGGQPYTIQRQKYRRLDLTLPWLSESEAMEDAIELDRHVADIGELIVVPEPGGTYEQDQLVYGRVAQNTPVRERYHGYWEKRIVVDELL